jgi:hypothetical protein
MNGGAGSLVSFYFPGHKALDTWPTGRYMIKIIIPRYMTLGAGGPFFLNLILFSIFFIFRNKAIFFASQTRFTSRNNKVFF